MPFNSLPAALMVGPACFRSRQGVAGLSLGAIGQLGQRHTTVLHTDEILQVLECSAAKCNLLVGVLARHNKLKRDKLLPPNLNRSKSM